MPTYEYFCSACAEKMDIVHSIMIAAKRKCSLCGARKLQRLISNNGNIIFKGDDWYRSIEYINDKARDKHPTLEQEGRK